MKGLSVLITLLLFLAAGQAGKWLYRKGALPVQTEERRAKLIQPGQVSGAKYLHPSLNI